MDAELESSSEDEGEIHEPSDYEYQPPLDEGAQSVFRQAHYYERRSGPMPDAVEMMRYKQVDETLPASIVNMARGEQSQRHEMERMALQGSLDETKRGQLLGFSIAAFVLLLSGVMAVAGFPVLAGILAGIDVVGLAAVFLGVRYVQKSEEPDSAEAQEPDPSSGTERDT